MKVSADRGGVAAGRDAIVGIPPDDVAVIIEALKREQKLTDDQCATIATLEEKLDVSEGALRAFFRALGEAEVPVEQLEMRLVAIAEDYKRARDQVAAAPGDAPEVAKLKNEARGALNAGELEKADALLEKVLAAQDAAAARQRLTFERQQLEAGPHPHSAATSH